MRPIPVHDEVPRSSHQQRAPTGPARDRGRLIGLWSKWSAAPVQDGARERFEQALQASVAERSERA
ncbi:MAG: hypothetical protein GX805_11265, partial [Gammaproteobacteria bacterium]|nr:hypothetical protein [Gammaproteobacteria bacterium]